MSLDESVRRQLVEWQPVNDNVRFDQSKWPGRENCYVYLILADFAFSERENRHLIKVGISSNPYGRMAGFQTATPFKINLMKTWRLLDRKSSLWVEKNFHDQNRIHRTNGEWFRMDAIGAAVDIDTMILCWWLAEHYEDGLFNYGGAVEFLMFSGLSREESEEVIAKEYGPLNTWGGW
jgi:hypothetical protein